MKFRKRPVEIEAMQFKGWLDSDPPFAAFVSACKTGEIRLVGSGRLRIPTLEGDMLADMGDWIIKGVKGEFYPCKPHIFKETYDEVIVAPPLPQDTERGLTYERQGGHVIVGEPRPLLPDANLDPGKFGQ